MLWCLIINVGLIVQFGESDYSVLEGSGHLEVIVSKISQNNAPIVVRVTPITITQYESQYGPVPLSLSVSDSDNIAEGTVLL